MLGLRGRSDKGEAPVTPGLHIVVVEDDDALAERLGMLFPEYAVSRVDHVDDAIKTAHSATVVVVGPAAVNEDTLERVEVIRDLGSTPLVTVVLVVARMSTAVLRRAMRAGVSDVLAESAPDDELTDVVRRAAERVEQVGRVVVGGSSSRGRIVAVFSPKGGAGTTTVAVNLAAAARTETVSPILVDADLPFGDVAITLGLDPSNSLADVTGSDMDVARLKGILTSDATTGLRALVAPADPARSEVITAADVGRTLELCCDLSPLVVVDTSAAFDDVTLSVLDKADDVILVASTDVATVKNAKVALQTLRQLEIAPGRIHLVLNRVPSRPLLSVSDVERALGQSAICIPDDPAVAKAAHSGVTVVKDAPRSAAARAYLKLAEELEANAMPTSTQGAPRVAY